MLLWIICYSHLWLPMQSSLVSCGKRETISPNFHYGSSLFIIWKLQYTVLVAQWFCNGSRTLLWHEFAWYNFSSIAVTYHDHGFWYAVGKCIFPWLFVVKTDFPSKHWQVTRYLIFVSQNIFMWFGHLRHR